MARKWRVLVLYECLIRVLGTALGGHEACGSLMLMLMLLMPLMPLLIELMMIMTMVMMMMTMLSRQSPLPLGEVAPLLLLLSPALAPHPVPLLVLPLASGVNLYEDEPIAASLRPCPRTFTLYPVPCTS